MKYVLMVLAFLLPMSLMAQATEGSILGVVSDPAGSVLVGAKVTVTSIETNFARETVSNGSGEYVVPNLPPGNYKVTAESAGFDTRTQSPVEMTIKARVRVDFAMQTGSVAQTVNVTSSAPLLKTDTSEVSTLISREELDSLPSIDRNFLSMQVLVPGTLRHTTSMGSDRIGDFSGGESMQVNGINAGQNNFILDGISNNVVLTGGMNSVPPIDAIQEVSIQTNGYSAEFGRAGGGIVNVALRSGTNQIHGYAYDYIQNDVFNARPYNFTSTNLTKVPLRRNLFGAGGGGPIVKDKAFVFFSYEGLRQPASARELDTTPTALERVGDFSKSNWIVYDPDTTDIHGNRQPFPNNQIPSNRIDPLMKRLASFFPLPNFTPVGTSLNNYAAVDVNNDTHDTYNVKGDINLTQRDLLTLRYSKQHSERVRSGWMPGGYIGGQGLLDGDNIGINETHTFTPNLLNELRIGYNYINDGNAPLNTTQVSELSEIPGGIAQPGFPAVSFTSIGSTKAVRPLATLPNPYIVWQNTLQIMENVSWHKGRHAIKVGADFNLQRNSVGGGAPPGGMKFSVDALATTPTTTAKKLTNTTGTAEGLLGYVSTLTTYNYNDKTRLYQSPWSLFVEDEWRVTNKLNLSLGLRYELTPTWKADGDLTTNFDLNSGKILVPNTTKGYVTNVVGLPGGTLPANYQYVDPSQVYAKPYHTDFAPRLGFAYSITPTFVFRGSYGIFYAPNAELGLNNQTGAPFSFQLQVIGDQAHPIKITSGFPTGGAAAELGSTDIAPVYYQPNYRTPIIQKFGSNVQWLPFKNTVTEIGYEGNRATGMDVGYQLNFPTPGPGDLNSRRPYPNLAEGTATVYAGDSNFNALEITVRQRALHGLTLQSALTIQHAYGQNGITDPYHFGYTEGRLASDYGKQWVTGLTYDLPVGRSLPYAARLVVGGWQAASIIQLHGGLPFSVASNNVMNDDLNASRADVNYDHGNPGSPDLGQRRSHLMWFNGDAFTNPANYTYGNSGINMLRGPGFQQFDLSMQKTFAITERYHATLRAEAENVFNRANLANPSATVGTAGFNQITATAADMRTMQMVFRVAF